MIYASTGSRKSKRVHHYREKKNKYKGWSNYKQREEQMIAEAASKDLREKMREYKEEAEYED